MGEAKTEFKFEMDAKAMGAVASMLEPVSEAEILNMPGEWKAILPELLDLLSRLSQLPEAALPLLNELLRRTPLVDHESAEQAQVVLFSLRGFAGDMGSRTHAEEQDWLEFHYARYLEQCRINETPMECKDGDWVVFKAPRISTPYRVAPTREEAIQGIPTPFFCIQHFASDVASVVGAADALATGSESESLGGSNGDGSVS